MKDTEFVILGSNWDLYKFAYSDLNDEDKALYIPGFYSRLNFIEILLFKFHMSSKLNRFLRLPYKYLWGNRLLRRIEASENVFFVFDSDWAIQDDVLHLVDIIRNRYKKSKCVCFLTDLYDTFRNPYNGKPIDIIALKLRFDLILSFDQNDCKKYGFIYYPNVFSKYPKRKIKGNSNEVYFLGQAKNRYEDIIRVYEKLKTNGIACNFHIKGVPRGIRHYEDEIDYTPNMTYIENLNHVANSCCILELVQENGNGLTYRALEAICLGKKLLTNSLIVKQTPFYNEKKMCVFQSVEDISVDFIKGLNNTDNIDYGYRGEFSPKNLLHFIKDYFDEK